MPRYILIDRASGYIFADTADLHGFGDSEGTPIAAAKILSATMDPDVAEFAETDRSDGRAVYDVYRADINGSDAIVVVQDGQSQEMIDAVERDCRYITSLRKVEAE